MNLGPFFGNYRQGFQFGTLGHDLAEQRGLATYRAKINFIIGAFINFWLRPLRTSIEHLRTALKAAVAEGDLNFASYCCDHITSQMLVAGEPLDDVYPDSETLLDFTRRSQFDPSSQIIIRTQRFIQAMRGLTASLSSFGGTDFDQEAYEQSMDQYGWPSVACIYYIMKLQLHVMSGDYKGAIAAKAKAKPLLWSILGMIHEAEYCFYSALASAAYYEQATP
jgi:predicted ATPase